MDRGLLTRFTSSFWKGVFSRRHNEKVPSIIGEDEVTPETPLLSTLLPQQEWGPPVPPKDSPTRTTGRPYPPPIPSSHVPNLRIPSRSPIEPPALRWRGVNEYGTTSISHDSEAQLEPGVLRVDRDGARKWPSDPRSTSGGARTRVFARRIDQLVNRFVVDWWALEILSWTFSAVCMSVLLGVLVRYNGESLPQWRFGITLNTFIAIMAGFAKSALLVPVVECLGQLKWHWFAANSRRIFDFEVFDNASRGPWGSFRLLLKTKGRGLATVGALVILLALPLDLFFQNTVKYQERKIEHTGSQGVIRRASIYEPLNIQAVQNGRPAFVPDGQMAAMATSFFIGAGSSPRRSEPEFWCPTSECTWPEFESLSVCSSCQDFSDQITWGCRVTTVDWIADILSPNATFQNLTACGYFLNITESKPTFLSGYALRPNTLEPIHLLDLRMVPLVDTITRAPLYGSGSLKFKDVRNPLLDVVIASIAGGIDGVLGNSTPIVQECVLNWCTHTYNTALSWGMLSQNKTNTQHDQRLGPFPWSVTNGSTKYKENITIIPADQHPSSANLVFGLSNITAIRTNIIFDDIFPAFSTFPNTSSSSTFIRRPFDPARRASQELKVNPWISQNKSDVSSHLEHLATAMTGIIRSGQDQSENDIVLGSAWERQTRVQINWEWYSLPVCLLVLSLGFLIGTAWKSRKDRAHVGIWKSSALAVLMNRISDDAQKNLGEGYSMGEARTRAKKTRIRLFQE